MGLIKLGRARSTGPVVLLVMGAGAIIALLIGGFIDFCPEGLVRDCVHVVQGLLDGAACECVEP